MELEIETECSLSDYFRIVFGNNRIKVGNKRYDCFNNYLKVNVIKDREVDI